MKIKDLQKRLDYLIEQVKENPNQLINYELIRVRGFSMVFNYFYNEIYGISQVKIRFCNFLTARISWYDCVIPKIDRIDAFDLYVRFIEFVEYHLNMFKDDLLNDLKVE